jgi:DNA-binding CsgD family transcriptional regulator
LRRRNPSFKGVAGPLDGKIYYQRGMRPEGAIVKNGNRNSTLPVGSPEFYIALGALASEVGRSRFYRDLARILCRVGRGDLSLVMRYARFSAPDFLVNEIMPREAVDLYFAGYYRLDPFYNYWRQFGQCGVVPVKTILCHNKNEYEYFNVIYRQAHIHDEIAVFLPAPGGASIAVFVERAADDFDESDIELIKLVYPTIDGLHKTHLDWLFLNSNHDIAGAVSREIPRAVMILDRDGRRVFTSREWRDTERRNPQLDRVMRTLKEEQVGLVEFGENMVVHAEKLRGDFPIAPNGTICVIEPRGSTPVETDYAGSVSRFIAAHGLTPREGHIVELILAGCPTEDISRKLQISRGTVKNHRGRLYYKLDITTERELFALFLPHLLKTWVAAEPSAKRA